MLISLELKTILNIDIILKNIVFSVLKSNVKNVLITMIIVFKLKYLLKKSRSNFSICKRLNKEK